MSGHFPPELIEQVRISNDIVTVLSEYLPLKKKGRNYFALCPFHTEKTPSFSVNPQKQVYYCFGCGQGGTVINFLMTYEKLGFVETIRHLAAKANISLPSSRQRDEKLELTDKLYDANRLAQQFFHDNLQSASGEKARHYLTQRGVTEESIKLFQLGYAPDQWDGFLSLAQSKKIDTAILNSAGLIIPRSEGKGFFDRFKNRVLFPIFNVSGNVIAFSGRVLSGDDSPKYMNSPETPIYQKGRTLYGLNFSKEYIRDSNKVVIVEGNIDLVSLFQAGIKNVVAPCGTAFTSEHARLLSRYATEAVFFFDPDSAGQNAVIRSVDLLYDAGLEVKVAIIPVGEDPDSYVRKYGVEKTLEIINQASSYVRFRKLGLKAKFNRLAMPEQEQIINGFAATAANIKHELRRELFLRQVAEEFELTEKLLQRAVQKLTGSDSQHRRENYSPEFSTPLSTNWERGFLGILMENSDWFKKAEQSLSPDDFGDKAHRVIWELISNEYQSKEKLDLSDLLDRVKDADTRRLILEISDLQTGDYELESMFEDCINGFKLRRKNEELSRLKKLLKEAEKGNNPKQTEALSQQLQAVLKENQAGEVPSTPTE
ncbi:MAG: DNA primase [candidate division Zixibacteria bacterium]|nr:DNA primase [candidate division Zixibacteria bacterium]